MSDWLNYWRTVLVRAWLAARENVFPDTLTKVARDLLIFLVATGIAFVARQPLTDLGTIARADNPVLDNALPFVFGACAVIICFATYFLVEVLLISPFRAYRTLEGEAKATGWHQDSPALHHPQHASYRLWDEIDPLELYQAACLWVELSPPESSDTPLVGDASVSLYKLTLALESEELSYAASHLGPMDKMNIQLQLATSQRLKNPKTIRVTRADLMDYAETLGERPKFLYPDMRGALS